MTMIGAIPVFVTVVECGSFAAAARRLDVSKSAVSKRITQLEADLGARLLHRTTRKLSLTEAGENYLVHAQEALSAARNAEDAVAQLQQAPQGLLRVNAPMSFGRLHIAPLVPDFLQRYPGISLEVVLDDRVADLVEGGFDIAIRAGTLLDSSLVARRLAPCRNVLCAAPSYLALHDMPVEPADLLKHNCLHYAYFSGGSEWTFTGPAGPVSVGAGGNFQVNNSEALREAIVGGVGIGRLPTFVAAADLAAGRLVKVLEDFQMPSQTVYAVFPERRHLPAKVRAFIDFSVDRFGGGQPYWDREIFEETGA